jgi:hypothetical protein
LEFSRRERRLSAAIWRRTLTSEGIEGLCLESVEVLGCIPHDSSGISIGNRFRSVTPATTIIAVLTIAIGVGANAAIFSVIRAVLLKPLPYAHAERLVRLSERWPNLTGTGRFSQLAHPCGVRTRRHLSPMLRQRGHDASDLDCETFDSTTSSSGVIQSSRLARITKFQSDSNFFQPEA